MFAANNFGSVYFGQSFPIQRTLGVPIWVSPSNHAVNLDWKIPLVFIIPSTTIPVHFQIQIDTASTFTTGSLQTFASSSSTAGWEYYNGSSWVTIPSTGVPIAYIGQQARYTFQTEISPGVWYRRVRGRVAL